MALTRHYECDLCKELQDPRKLHWTLQASAMSYEIGRAGEQFEAKFGTLCPTCARIINTVMRTTLDRLRAGR